jgi:hypothetical protein
MSRLYKRAYRVTVDTIEITNIGAKSKKVGPGLDVKFSVDKTNKPEPNTANLTIYNLNPDHRAQLSEKEKPVVQIEAGYEEKSALIFKGELRSLRSFREGPDWLTELSTGDGEHKIRNARINKSYVAGTKLDTIIRDLADSLGVGKGNTDVGAALARWAGQGTEVLKGLVLSGSVKQELDGICRATGLEWSVQDGELQFLETTKPRQGVSVVLTPDTGLIGSPTIGSDGVVSMTSLMNADIVPGGLVTLETAQLPRANYKVARANYVGDTSGSDWLVDIEGKQL